MPFAMIGFFLGIYWIPIEEKRLAFDIAKQGHWATYYLDSINFPFEKFLLVLLCMIFARSAAMAFNRYLDRTFDAKNPRTAIREIPKGIISANSALRFTI